MGGERRRIRVDASSNYIINIIKPNGMSLVITRKIFVGQQENETGHELDMCWSLRTRFQKGIGDN